MPRGIRVAAAMPLARRKIRTSIALSLIFDISELRRFVQKIIAAELIEMFIYHDTTRVERKRGRMLEIGTD